MTRPFRQGRLGTTLYPIACALVAMLLACQPEPQQCADQPPETYSVVNPVVTTVAYEREYVGEVQAAQRVELRARVKGIIESIAVDEGQAVTKDQLLFSINARGLQQELAKARAATASAIAELKTAQIEQANTKLLFEKKIVADTQIAMADSKIRLLEAKVEEMRAAEGQAAINLTYSRVLAPFDGIVNRLPKKVGSLVAEDDLLTTVTNTSEVLVYFRISEQEYFQYTSPGSAAEKKEVSLRLADGELYASAGVIDAVENEFDRETGNIAFRARFPNQAGRLKHGSTGTVIVGAEVKDGMVIPQASTFEIQDQLYVYTVGADNTARARRVVPKVRLKDKFVIESGLDPDDRIIVEGIQKVRDGVKVAVQPARSSARTSL